MGLARGLPAPIHVGEKPPILQYKAGFKFVGGGVHAQVLDCPAAITCGAGLDEARRLLGIALVDVAEAAIESGQLLPAPDPTILDPDMDIEEPISLHFRATADVREEPVGTLG